MILPINKIGDEVLEMPCKEVDLTQKNLARRVILATRCANFLDNFVRDMIETAQAHDAVGLAANQVGESLRIFVFDIGEGEFKVAINPTINYLSPFVETKEEGCLSVPKIRAEISRPIRVGMDFYNEHGAKTGLMTGGTPQSSLVARIMLHELDHLNGINFLSKASKIWYVE